MNKINLLKKYAYAYLSKYDSTKKNLEWKLKNKISKMTNVEKKEKFYLYNSINSILNDLEVKNIINDKIYTQRNIQRLYDQGKSEFFIKSKLLQKGIDNKLINSSLKDFEKDNPNYKINAAIKFAEKKKLGKYGNIDNKQKDISKMARAGFSYYITLKALGF
tara:strand:- start:424 stop:909 length:486 start_codon:yes stop_codon:yes gene_type:complete